MLPDKEVVCFVLKPEINDHTTIFLSLFLRSLKITYSKNLAYLFYLIFSDPSTT